MLAVKPATIVTPLPDERLLSQREKSWQVKLPADYRQFLRWYNGCIPQEQVFSCGNWDYVVERFLCLVADYEQEAAIYDIEVVESQVGERLTSNSDQAGIAVLPIAALFSGDFLCLDYRPSKEQPKVVIWYHETSGEFEPDTTPVASSFTDFLTLLRD